MLLVVLNDWVTDTNETPSASKSSTSFAKSASDLVSRDHDYIDPPGADGGQEPLQGRPVERPAREAAIIEALPDQSPALVGLALDVGLGRLALRVERVEVLLEPVIGGYSRVDRAA